MVSFKEYSWLKGLLHSLSLELFRGKKEKRWVKSHHEALHLKKKLQSVKGKAVGRGVDSEAISPGLTLLPPALLSSWTIGQMTYLCLVSISLKVQ